MSYVVVFLFSVSEGEIEVTVCFVDIDAIVDRHC
jgi:hypothetical protein